ncbi:MAG: hypothetical protein ABR951_10705 [Candidatus Aminicenantales bacterium]
MNAGKMTSTPARIAAAVLIAGVSLAMALEPPTREQVERYRKDGTLAARVAQAKSFGNHRLAPRLVSRLREKIVPKARVPALRRRAGGGALRQPEKLLPPVLL